MEAELKPAVVDFDFKQERPGGTPLAMLAAQCNKLASKSPPPLADAAVGKGFHPWKKAAPQGSSSTPPPSQQSSALGQQHPRLAHSGSTPYQHNHQRTPGTRRARTGRFARDAAAMRYCKLKCNVAPREWTDQYAGALSRWEPQ